MLGVIFSMADLDPIDRVPNTIIIIIIIIIINNIKIIITALANNGAYQNQQKRWGKLFLPAGKVLFTRG